MSTGGALTIADRNGRILARTPEPEKFVGTVIPEAFQRLVRADKPGTEALLSQDGTHRIVGYIPSSSPPEGIYVSAGVSTEQAYGLVWRLARAGSLVVILGLLASLILVWTTSRAFVVRPVARLVNTINAWRDGNTDARSGMSAAAGEIGTVGAALDTFMDELIVTRAERKKAEHQKQLITQELNHRVKNLLSVINVVVRQTFGNPDAKDPLKTFTDRLRAIAGANDILAHEKWHAASILDIIEDAVAPFRDRIDRFRLSGPTIMLTSSSAMALGMALHELCTNAVKYGALSVDAGRVALSWSVGDDDQFEITWTEKGGPPVHAPSRTGFGSRVITQVLEGQIAGKVVILYEAEGLVCQISAPIDRIVPAS